MTDFSAVLHGEADRLTAIIAGIEASAQSLRGIADQLPSDDDQLPYIDRVADMPVNASPFHRDFVRVFPGRSMWPTRDLDTLTGVTIHHTLSHSLMATARYCTASKGYPTTSYHYWVSATDGCPVYMLVEPTVALWHDHTGSHPTTLSIGMAGALHVTRPPDEQIHAAARLVSWILSEYDIHDVRGHCDRYTTVCPGWNKTHWRDDFFYVLGNITGGD